jgi:MtfA peptidase
MSITTRWRQWVQAWRLQQDRQVLQRRAVPASLWDAVLQRHRFLAERPAQEQQALRELVSHFLDRKEFHAVPPLALTDEMAVSVAAQACLPILKLGLDHYDDFVGIVMQPTAVRAPRSTTDEVGVVHRYDEELAGEAMEGGPLMLSWEDVQHTGAPDEPAFNVVIHEFAHVLDLRDGQADGMPLMPTTAAQQAWMQVLQPEYDWFCERVVCGHPTAIDPYGAEAIDEFFAVASEAFFVKAQALQEEQPALYRLLSSYYRQDPAAYARQA